MSFKFSKTKSVDSKFVNENTTIFAVYDPINPKNKRIPQQVVDKLEYLFSMNPRPNTAYLRTLVKELQLDLKKLKTWFQNRRAKAKRDNGELTPHPSVEYSGTNTAPSGEMPLPTQRAPTPQHFSNNTSISYLSNEFNFFSDVNYDVNQIAPPGSPLKLMNNLTISTNLHEFGKLYLEDSSSSISPTTNFDFNLGYNLDSNFNLACLPHYMNIDPNTNKYNIGLTDPNFSNYESLNSSAELLTDYNYSLQDPNFNLLPMFTNLLNNDFVTPFSSINSSTFGN